LAQEDIEIVRTLYAAFNRNDRDGVIALLGNAMVAHVAEGMPWSGSYYGPDGFRRFLEILDEHVEFIVETDSLIDTGPVVAQVGRADRHLAVAARHVEHIGRLGQSREAAAQGPHQFLPAPDRDPKMTRPAH